ncbi:MAG TPA: SDR family NAD(P)-dependent oxidoreductase [Solirubrobacterales bacterium]|nr:SDR family NAD(P)-dependent oxidoreductase [Solirubrobacterales bacterium]
MEVAGKTTLLTGATGGLGRAIAAALAARGAKLILSGRQAEALEALAAELPGAGHRALAADLAEEGAGAKLVADAGEVDVLVANAGLPGSGRIDEYDAEQMARVLRVNLEAPMQMARVLEGQMAARGRGHMVFIASLAGKSATPLASIYAATKFGLRGFALSLRADLSSQGVGVSLVTPGFIRGAGLLADSGAGAPPGLGTASPAQVGAAVVEAIEKDKVEVVVAPLHQRALGHFALCAPSLNVRTASGGLAKKSAAAVAAGQLDKR